MMKRMIAVAATLVLTATTAFAAAESYTVGIGQFAEHGSLNNCRTGFVEGLAEAGLVEGDNLTTSIRTRKPIWASLSRSPRSLQLSRLT